MKRAAIAIGVPAVLILGYMFYVAGEIARQSTLDEARKADAILVMGAAEYRGRPSQVLEGRLNHALLLYLRGLAPYVITTGGAGGDPHFTEGDVGRSYLIQHGVPSESILDDPEGATTAESLSGAAEIMHRENLHSCIVVSDGYHIYRVKRLLQVHGVQVYGSPRPSPGRITPMQMRWLYWKQAVRFALWQVGINI